MIVHRKTGSKEVITYLNRLEYCLSYEKLLQLDTFDAKNESKKTDISFYIPKYVKKLSFHMMVYDVHCTNGILTQRQETLYFKAAIDTLLWKVMQLSNETTADENLSFLLPTLLHIIK